MSKSTVPKPTVPKSDTHNPQPENAGHLVPDLLAPGLLLVLIGTAPSHISAKAQAYYANPQNKFWPTLHAAGLTPRQLRPQEYPKLLELGIGLTDVAKKFAGVDAALPTEAWEAGEVRGRLRSFQPKVVAFTSKRGASEVLGVPTGKLPYGRFAEQLEGAEVWILPSTSPLAHSHFQLLPWLELGARIQELRGERPTSNTDCD